ncbi:hypothetical protein Pmani_028702 [Petrolisthes manimaculis]|uniref:EF-hand domain-containing protein n=1 Tax=Petrolisthes manimaculis TaxID=1843537 RepID=A0AAE1NZ08_9EUCA|nr:hypothetical protein Pmani_028702 [Petrolisthes manimaculis]
MGKNNSKLTPKVLDDLKANTAFSAEIYSFYEGFNQDCPNGRLSVDQFKKIYTDLFPNGDASMFAENTFRTFDSNKDGIIDFREFLCGLSLLSKGKVEDKLKWAFSMYDQDDNGSISREEMLKIFTSLYKMSGMFTEIEDIPEKRTDEIFLMLDKDMDGTLSLEEFIAGVKSDPSLLNVMS